MDAGSDDECRNTALSADEEETWHPPEVRNIFANFASRTDDRLKATADAALALHLTGHDYAVDDLCDRAMARGLDPDAVRRCLQDAQERAADRELRRKADFNIFQREIDRHNASSHDAKAPPPEPFVFDPPAYIPPDPAKIPRREWLYGKYYIRGVVSATLGAPGRLKSTVGMTDAISMATGMDLMDGKKPLAGGSLNAAYINGEENQDELDRRLAAICQRYDLKPEDHQGRIWIISTRDKPLRFAVAGKGGNGVIAEDVVSAIEAWCDKNKIDVVIFDPVVSFHRVRENDPGDMDMLYKEGFGRIAGKTRAVDLAIHPRKPVPGALNTTMDDLRGTGAQEGAIRAARIFNFMTTAEADQLGIDEDHRRLHVRIDGGKNNPGPIAKATWVKIETEDLPNGDTVAVATPWNPPNPFDGVTAAQMHECRKVVQGGAFRADVQSPDWVGYAVANVIGIDINHDDKERNKEGRVKVKQVLKTWLKNKVLDIEEREDAKRNKRKYVIPGKWLDEAICRNDDGDELALD